MSIIESIIHKSELELVLTDEHHCADKDYICKGYAACGLVLDTHKSSKLPVT